MRKISHVPIRWVVVIATMLVAIPAQQDPPEKRNESKSAEAPEWFAERMAWLTRGSGRWTTPAPEGTPFATYQISWSYGVGGASVVGRLMGIAKDSSETTFWEFRLFWHPGDRRAIVQQFGKDGTFGSGSLVLGEVPGKSVLVQAFVSPNGRRVETRHETTRIDDDTERSVVTDVVDGKESPPREWTWKRARQP